MPQRMREDGDVLDPRSVVALLKAAAEPTRLRILMLLQSGELNVKDLTRIMGQSQPRISRHLKLMSEAGLIERHQDGSWAFFQLVQSGPANELIEALLASVSTDDPILRRDTARAVALKVEREAAAQDYFRVHAAEWDRIRALHISEATVEAALVEALAGRQPKLLVDLGTGTARMLELFRDSYARAIGFDANHTMLAYARGRLDAAAISHASVRHGDLYDVPLASESADAVIMHQVLHFLADPVQALREAARILAPGGRLVIADFAPHNLDFLRESFAHERLGFVATQVKDWIEETGLVNVATRELTPEAGASDEKLTVILWTADRPEIKSGADGRPARRKVEA